MNRQVAGIDLGTYNTSCTVRSFTPYPDHLQFSGGNLLPSFVFLQWDKEKNASQCILGPNVKGTSLAYPRQLLYGSKRLIGHEFYSDTVQNFIEMNEDTLNILEVRGKPVYKVDYYDDQNNNKIKEEIFTPEDISAEILKKVASTYKDANGGEQLKSCVITVPAKFNTNQRKATLNAATKAGLNCLRLVNEPTAAAFCYKVHCLGKDDTSKKTVIVFDFGAGTLDVSIVEFDGNSFNVIHTEGNSQLGGIDIDHAICEFVLNKFKDENNGYDKANPKMLATLMIEAEKCKIKLSSSPSAEIFIPGFWNGIDLNVTLRRRQFETLIDDIIEKAKEVLNTAIKASKVNVKNITSVIPIGGTCKIPAAIDILNEIFDDDKIVSELDIEHSVSEGAYYICQIIESGGHIEEIGKYADSSSTPKRIGAPSNIIEVPTTDRLTNFISVLLSNNSHWNVFPPGKQFPLHRIDHFKHDPLEPCIRMDVYEGGKEANSPKTLVSKINIPNVPKDLTSFSMKFIIDHNGILNVAVLDSDNNEIRNAIIHMDFSESGEKVPTEAEFLRKCCDVQDKIATKRRNAQDKRPFHQLTNDLDDLIDSAKQQYVPQDHLRELDVIIDRLSQM